MEYIWLWGLLLAVMIIVFYKPNFEMMTNKDLLATLHTFGTKDKSSKDVPHEEAIYGPKVPKMEEPSPASPNNGKPDDSNIYPDIYGPEITPIPGTKHKDNKGKHKDNKGKHTSDDHEDEDTYQFNPDLAKAFPMEENEPQPFLTDFSQFQS